MPYVPPYLPGNPMMPYQMQNTQYDPSLAYQQMLQQYQNMFGQQNANMPQMANTAPQTMIQNQIPQHLCGRIVADPKEILAKEIDMDGRICYFPTADQSMIYAKTWDSNGNLVTTTYQRIAAQQDQEHPDVQTMALANILDRLTNIEKILSPRTAVKKKGDIVNEQADA